jgi:hypothetical protein
MVRGECELGLVSERRGENCDVQYLIITWRELRYSVFGYKVMVRLAGGSGGLLIDWRSGGSG